MQARWLLEDGVRLAESDTARAAARFREAVKLSGTGPVAGRASLQLVRLSLRGVSHPQELSSLIRTLRGLAKDQGVTAEATQLGASAAGVLATSASLMPGSPQGDLRLFLAAEAARDTLQAARLAEGMFLRIFNGWPHSPYAPKAILAAQQLNPAWADSGRALLEARYLDSPYLAVIRGEEGSAYRKLEDSLGAFASAGSIPAPRATPSAPARPAPGVRDDDDQPTRRRPQPARTRRVAEP
jgi:hypothetical protein